MKQVHISKNLLTSIKLEVNIDMKLANDIWFTMRDRRMHIIKVRMGIDYPTIPIVRI